MNESSSPKTFYRFAMFCGIAPLLTGTLIFALWLLARWDWLIPAGIYTIIGGVLLVGAGALSLLVYAFDAGLRGDSLLKSLVCGAMLLTNFPAAAGIVWTVVVIETRYFVAVRNRSSQTLQRAELLGPGCARALGDIAPDDSASGRLAFRGDGVLIVRFTLDGRQREQIIEGYVTGNMGGHAEVTVQPDGTVTVAH